MVSIKVCTTRPLLIGGWTGRMAEAERVLMSAKRQERHVAVVAASAGDPARCAFSSLVRYGMPPSATNLDPWRSFMLISRVMDCRERLRTPASLLTRSSSSLHMMAYARRFAPNMRALRGGSAPFRTATSKSSGFFAGITGAAMAACACLCELSSCSAASTSLSLTCASAASASCISNPSSTSCAVATGREMAGAASAGRSGLMTGTALSTLRVAAAIAMSTSGSPVLNLTGARGAAAMAAGLRA
mmetsp:Transcript_19634/g.42914  ORF Transcript_19634/g.42914 Transcript_19634/m.42914 type:complete len:245 (+) Transcript_19634:85-819(+)